MAGDWIKMRMDLLTHPKVVRMASALKADNLRTIGGLMSVWCLFDVHSEDGRLDGYTLETIDAHLRWEGFAAAMKSVGWLDDSDSEGLLLPRFDSHNGQSAKRRAQDADRKREDRKASASDADKKRTREEKRREEKKEGSALPEWVPVEAWSGFVDMRKRIKKPLTDRAVTRMVNRLAELRAQGCDLETVLDEATTHCWQDVYAPKTASADAQPWAGAV